MTWAAVFLAMSALLWPPLARARTGAGLRPTLDGAPPDAADDAMTTAAALDLLGGCLRSGMAVSTAAAAVAPSAPSEMAVLLRRAADLLALGADPSRAWAAVDTPVGQHCAAFQRMARRSAASGAALAQGVEDLAARLRAQAADEASARAGRASVLIAGPLGLCYLPAFFCLGIVPVVAGLADEVLQSGVL